MKVIGVGFDTVDVSRIQKNIRLRGDRFLNKIYTKGEQDYCQKKAHPEKHFASRFAAKEAFLKALGIGLSEGISWQDISVRSTPKGAPSLKLKGAALKKANKMGVKNFFLSLSDEKNLSFAFVVLTS